jgi:Xaa-Pro aminopeptidase
MQRDIQRVQRIVQALQKNDWDALVCTLPMNVLLLSGYWPFVGAAIAVATREGKIGVLAPDDAARVASQGWADELGTFQMGSLDDLRDLEEIVRDPLTQMLRSVGLRAGNRVAYEDAAEVEPATYAALNIYGAAVPRLLCRTIPGISLAHGSAALSDLRSVLTQREVNCVREACQIVQRSYESGRVALCAGLTEVEIAEAFRAGLSTFRASFSNQPKPVDQVFRAPGSVAVSCLCATEISRAAEILPDGASSANQAEGRADGFVYCMSGPNSASAYAAYQHSTDRTVHSGDFVLVHCNSYVNGFWTDVTRTFCIGRPDDQKRQIYDAILEAHDAAIDIIRPGISASRVDRVVREVLTEQGFGPMFKHSTGHGVGFAAINHLAKPRIHPKSDDVLEPGMTFNIEPAVYIEGYGGARHCDVVTVTEAGAEVLTPFLEIL